MLQTSAEPNQQRRARATAWVLGVVLFASYAYFYQAGGWNQNSRFALVRAILENHSPQVDPYQLPTSDKALCREHSYSDDPPGTAPLVLPTVQPHQHAASPA